MLHEQGLDELICAKLQLHTKPANLARWDKLVDEVEHPAARGDDRDVRQVRRPVRLVQVAQRGAAPRRHPQPRAGQDRVRSTPKTSTPTNVANLARFDAILVPGGFGKRGVEGKILAAQYAREKKIPYLGICLGMQVATIEYARHKAGLDGANSTEFDPRRRASGDRPDRRVAGPRRLGPEAHAQSDLGGTMRLGAQSSDVKPGTLAHEIYGNVVTERHRHRYEANEHYLDRLHRGRPGDLGDHPAREADRDRRAADERAPVVRRRAVPPRVQVDAVGRPSRCSSPSSTPRSSTRPQRSREGRRAETAGVA